MGDLLDVRVLRARLARVLPERNAILHESYGLPGFDLELLLDEAVAWGERLRPHIIDTTSLVQEALAAGRHVILEGAQGTLLDLDHGTYPYVTSSNPVAGPAQAAEWSAPSSRSSASWRTTRVHPALPHRADDATGRYLLEKAVSSARRRAASAAAAGSMPCRCGTRWP
jgi:adenylosuccinate synthase